MTINPSEENYVVRKINTNRKLLILISQHLGVIKINLTKTAQQWN